MPSASPSAGCSAASAGASASPAGVDAASAASSDAWASPSAVPPRRCDLGRSASCRCGLGGVLGGSGLGRCLDGLGRRDVGALGATRRALARRLDRCRRDLFGDDFRRHGVGDDRFGDRFLGDGVGHEGLGDGLFGDGFGSRGGRRVTGVLGDDRLGDRLLGDLLGGDGLDDGLIGDGVGHDGLDHGFLSRGFDGLGVLDSLGRFRALVGRNVGMDLGDGLHEFSLVKNERMCTTRTALRVASARLDQLSRLSKLPPTG